MNILKLNVSDDEAASSVVSAMEKLPANSIGNVNWPTEYPYAPEVSFRIAHNGSSLFLLYNVREQEVMAEVADDNGEVWTDSCVEFFISLGDSPYYYNIETSCIGKLLIGYRKTKKEVEHAPKEVLALVERVSSLGSEPFAKKQGNCSWSMLLKIPAAAFWRSDLSSFDGLTARGNFYKCGDKLTEPHFLSWNPIGSEHPNFHLPEFFGDLKFA